MLSNSNSNNSDSLFESSISSYSFSLETPHITKSEFETAKISKAVFFNDLWNLEFDVNLMFNKAFPLNTNTFESSEITLCSLDKIKYFYETFLQKFEVQKKNYSDLCYQNLNRTIGSLGLLIFGDLIQIEIIHEKTLMNSKGVVEYFLQIKDSLNEKEWGFYARYSKLRSFHEKIVKELCENSIANKFFKKTPPFPNKKWFGNKDPAFINQRAKDLSHYFSEILKTKALLEEGTLKKILYNECKKHIDEEIKREFFFESWSKISEKKEIDFPQLKKKIENEIKKFESLLNRISIEANDIKRCNSLNFYASSTRKN